MKRYLIPFLDLFINLMIYFSFLFVIVYSHVAIEESDFTPKVRYIITLEWDPKSANDIDFWLKAPNDQVIYFSKKEMMFATLERDDLGINEDTFIDPQGNIIRYNQNNEVIYLREVISGKYVLNVHFYQQKGTGKPIENVKVKIVQILPAFKQIFEGSLDLKVKEEKTALRFWIEKDKNGPKIVKSDTVPEMYATDVLLKKGVIR